MRGIYIGFQSSTLFESPQGNFVGLSLGNCQHCEHDLLKKVGVAAHAVISKKNA
jgi:hypothetical protein